MSFIVATVLFYSANHYYPQGPKIATGDYVCEHDDRGKCVPAYIEDLRGMNLPYWVILFKRSEGTLLWIVLLIAASFVSNIKIKNIKM